MRTTPLEIHISEQLVLRGQRYGEPGDRWAVLIHDESRDLDAWHGLSGPLAGLGLCVLAFDLAGHGTSDDPWDPRCLRAHVLEALRLAESAGAFPPHLLRPAGGGAAA